MKKNVSRFNRHRDGQTPAIVLDDSANFKKHENSIMVPEPSGEFTNQGPWMDMQRGG